MKRYISATASQVPTLHIYVDVVCSTVSIAASEQPKFGKYNLFPEDMSISRRNKKSAAWVKTVNGLIVATIDALQSRRFLIIDAYPSKRSYTYYIRFQPVDKYGDIILEELQLQIELRDHVSHTHPSEGQVSDNLFIKSFTIENTVYPDVWTTLQEIIVILEQAQQGDISAFNDKGE